MQGVEHYENFPVASWLCPRPLRAPIAAIYHFARTADDLADEGSASPAERLADLQLYRAGLHWAVSGEGARPVRWHAVFQALQGQIRTHRLPAAPLHALLDAFEQDTRHTAQGTRYADLNELLDYCNRSANPVGRLLLHLYGVEDADSLQQSDAICSALQLVNFWQDLSVDLPRHRHYLPTQALQRHLVDDTALAALPDTDPMAQRAQAMLAELCAHARELMGRGAPLALRLPGRAGWELRLVVQGGLRVLDHIERLQHRTWRQRPTLTRFDAPVLLWRALRMRA